MRVSPLGSEFDRGRFDSGERSLDTYLRRQAGQDVRKRIAACFVLHPKSESRVVGFYTLSACSIVLADVPDELARRLPHYPRVPATLLGRLAIDRSLQGHGWGRRLTADALLRARANSHVVGSWAVITDPINASASQFYRKFGFREIAEAGGRMFLRMVDIQS